MNVGNWRALLRPYLAPAVPGAGSTQPGRSNSFPPDLPRTFLEFVGQANGHEADADGFRTLASGEKASLACSIPAR